MNKAKKKEMPLCSCGFPQSFPIPHEHDRTEREKQIINYYERRDAMFRHVDAVQEFLRAKKEKEATDEEER